MRVAIGGLAATAVLALAGCTSSGTPAPSSVTITPTLHWATPSAGASRKATPRPSGRAPQAPGSTVLLSPDRVGTLALGAATPADAVHVLDGLLGAHASAMTCGGRGTVLRWGSLSVTFAGAPSLAREWEVDVEKGTSGLRLPRGSEWSPEREALLTRDDATVTTSGTQTVVTLAEGLRYGFGKNDRRARTIGAGTPVCG